MNESKVWEGNIFGQSFVCGKNQTQVWCIKHLFGILEPQEFEWEEDAVFYETLYATSVNLVMVKNVRKGMWRYWDKTFTFVL